MPSLFGFIVLLLPFIHSSEKPKFIVHFFLYFIGASLVVNPYLILNFKEFYSYNYDALFGFQTSSDEMKGYPFGYEFYWTESYGSYFKYMVMAAMGFFGFKTIVEARNKQWPMLIFLSMPLAYFLCFSPFHTRYYWFIVLVPYVVFMFAYAWDALATKLNQKIATIALLLLLSGATLFNVFASNYRVFDAVVFHTSALERADAFLDETLKRNERIIHVARQSRAPQTYNIDLQKEAQHGQYFMYERIRNDGYKNFFIEAHRDLVRKRKTYNVIAFDRANYDQYKGHQLEKLMYTDLLNYAYSNQVKFIILTYNREEYVAEWEADARAEKVFDSFEMNDVYGPNVKVYKLSY